MFHKFRIALKSSENFTRSSVISLKWILITTKIKEEMSLTLLMSWSDYTLLAQKTSHPQPNCVRWSISKNINLLLKLLQTKILKNIQFPGMTESRTCSRYAVESWTWNYSSEVTIHWRISWFLPTVMRSISRFMIQISFYWTSWLRSNLSSIERLSAYQISKSKCSMRSF